jgi:hypothetical protein
VRSEIVQYYGDHRDGDSQNDRGETAREAIRFTYLTFGLTLLLHLTLQLLDGVLVLARLLTLRV